MTGIHQVRKGSTPLLILGILEKGPRHGYAIMRKLEERSIDYYEMTAALLYPTLHQMEQDQWVTADWQDTPGQRRKKIYTITAQGKKQLNKGNLEWQRFFENLFNVMKHTQKI